MPVLGENYFDIVIGEKLSSVTFVMDYLQLDFDGNRFTLNLWPTLNVANSNYEFNDAGYRDKLCQLITEIVKKIVLVEDDSLLIEFETGNSIFISLDPNNPEIVTPEIVYFIATDNSWLTL